jgi:hypothetical protein
MNACSRDKDSAHEKKRKRERERERNRKRERERERCIVVQFPERSSGVEFSTFLLLKTDVQIKYLEESGDEGRWD